MKKIIILGIMAVLMIGVAITDLEAESYQNYQEIVFDSDEAKLLQDFNDSEYQNYLKKLRRKKFFGWSIEVVHENEGVEYIAETKLKIYNNGYSTIKHDITLESEAETKYQLSATGGIKVSVDGNIKKFKGSVDADIKASISYTSVQSSSEKYEFEIIVDPMTYVKILVRGEGVVNNGVGKYYAFWINTKSGGWETFTVTTEYYEIIKEKI